MSMLSATELRKGHVISYKNQLWIVQDALHITPGNLRGFVRAKMRSLQTGVLIEERLQSTDKFEQAFIEQREVEFSYKDQNSYVFSDPKTYEQISVRKDLVSDDDAPWFVDGMKLKINLHEGEPFGIELPQALELKVVSTEPFLKGATVSNVFKPAKLENGLTVQVPPFIDQGEVIRVSPVDRKYIERVPKG